MSNSDHNKLENVKEDHHQKDAVKDDCSYEFVSDDLRLELDEFLDLWRDELNRKKNILRLNDDCFYKIFSYLPANDFCAVSETCRDFQRASHYYIEGHSKRFRLKHRNFYDDRSKIRLSDAKRFIRKFGQHLSQLWLRSFSFECDETPIKLLPLLEQYCDKLEDLGLDVVACSDPMTIIRYQRLVSNLHRLSIGTCSSDPVPGPADVDVILTHFSSLMHLELTNTHWTIDDKAHVARRYETLQSLSLRNTILPGIDAFTAFLSENHQLKRLKFSSCFFRKNASESEHSFTLTLPPLLNLESFWARSRDYKYISKLRNIPVRRLFLSDISDDVPALKKLRLDMSYFLKTNINSLFSRLAVHNIIEKITLMNSPEFPNELENHLCALTALKVLRFHNVYGFNDEIIKQLACGLPNLTHVGFEGVNMTTTMIEPFLEYSHNVTEIYLYTYALRSFDRHSYEWLKRTMLSSMVNARLRNKHNKLTLTLILNGKTLADGKRLEPGLARALEECVSVIKVLPRNY